MGVRGICSALEKIRRTYPYPVRIHTLSLSWADIEVMDVIPNPVWLRARTFLTLQATCGRGRQVSSNWQEECTARLHWHAQTGPIDYPVATRGRAGGPLDSIGEPKPMLNFARLLRLVYPGLKIEAPIHFFALCPRASGQRSWCTWVAKNIEVSNYFTGRRTVCGRGGGQ